MPKIPGGVGLLGQRVATRVLPMASLGAKVAICIFTPTCHTCPLRTENAEKIPKNAGNDTRLFSCKNVRSPGGKTRKKRTDTYQKRTNTYPRRREKRVNGQHAVPLFPPVRVGPPLPGKVKNEETGSMPFYIFPCKAGRAPPMPDSSHPWRGNN